ncbi:hypothetical protein APHAL10511_007509 [Amanita phalloides]|nr:hypothetical protein APHAL10511_007509 [Amanita phalloides]
MPRGPVLHVTSGAYWIVHIQRDCAITISETRFVESTSNNIKWDIATLPGNATKSSIGQGLLFAASRGLGRPNQLLVGEQAKNVDWIISQSPSENTAYRIYFVDSTNNKEYQWSFGSNMVVLKRETSYDWKFQISLISPPSPGTTGPGTTGPGTTGPGTTGPAGTTGPGTAGSGTTGPARTTGPGTAGSGTPGPGTAGPQRTASPLPRSQPTATTAPLPLFHIHYPGASLQLLAPLPSFHIHSHCPGASLLLGPGRELPMSPQTLEFARLYKGAPKTADSTGVSRATRKATVEIDIACFQAATTRQVKDLAELFANGWAYVPGARTCKTNMSCFNPVFYRKNTFKVLSKDSFWLSEDPFRSSKFPGARAARVCTAVRFSSIKSGKEFTVLNTHLDPDEEDQRRLAASMLLARARYAAVTSGPVFVTGTLNCDSTGSSSGAYKILNGSAAPVSVPPAFEDKYAVRYYQLPKFRTLDLRAATPKQRVSVNYATHTGYTDPGDTSKWRRTSYIFGGSNKGWTSVRPVFADVSI